MRHPLFERDDSEREGNVAKLGVFEIFFGTPWPSAERLALPKFLKAHSFDFYVYGPKADKRLRKDWRSEWPMQYLEELTVMARAFRAEGVRFGVALSPYGIGERLTEGDRCLLERKVRELDALGIEVLGLFFDDMPVTPGLAESQLAAFEVIRGQTTAQIVFCPTFYCFDPLLEKIFGAKPEGYLEKIAAGLGEAVEIAWTGPKVISEEISAEHLREVSQLLGRPPFLCDNFFANDGPRNCKYLKLKEPFGRSREAMAEAGYWAQNPMNQFHLSKLVLLAFKLTARDGAEPAAAFERAARELCTPPVADFVLRHRPLLLSRGLDGIAEGVKSEWLDYLTEYDEPISREIRDWLSDRYQVGTECLTD